MFRKGYHDIWGAEQKMAWVSTIAMAQVAA
jgi:hypothetical protein